MPKTYIYVILKIMKKEIHNLNNTLKTNFLLAALLAVKRESG